MILTDLQNAILEVLASSKKIRWTELELRTNLRNHEVTKTQSLSTSALFEAVEELEQYGYITYNPQSGTKNRSFAGLRLTDEGRKAAH